MSYDLDFWKYKPGVMLDHQQVYERLSDGQQVEGLCDLPIVDILQRVKIVFTDAGWEQLDELNWEGDDGAFQIFTTPQFIRFDCYSMDGDDMNRIIDIADEFDCPLYDPQAGQRYDG